MEIDKIIKEILMVEKKSLEQKKPARVDILMNKRDIYHAYLVGNPLVNDGVVGYFDSFTGFDFLQIYLVFDGLGGVNQKLFAIKG